MLKAEGAGEGEDGGGASGSHGNNASNGGTNSNGKRYENKIQRNPIAYYLLIV